MELANSIYVEMSQYGHCPQLILSLFLNCVQCSMSTFSFQKARDQPFDLHLKIRK